MSIYYGNSVECQEMLQSITFLQLSWLSLK